METIVLGYQKLQQTITETPVKISPAFTLRMLLTFMMANSGCNHDVINTKHQPVAQTKIPTLKKK